jgi:hypothetical protein
MWSIAAPAATSCSADGLLGERVRQCLYVAAEPRQSRSQQGKICVVADLSSGAKRMPTTHAANETLYCEPGRADRFVRTRERANMLEGGSSFVARTRDRWNGPHADHYEIEQTCGGELQQGASPGGTEQRALEHFHLPGRVAIALMVFVEDDGRALIRVHALEHANCQHCAGRPAQHIIAQERRICDREHASATNRQNGDLRPPTLLLDVEQRFRAGWPHAHGVGVGWRSSLEKLVKSARARLAEHLTQRVDGIGCAQQRVRSRPQREKAGYGRLNSDGVRERASAPRYENGVRTSSNRVQQCMNLMCAR